MQWFYHNRAPEDGCGKLLTQFWGGVTDEWHIVSDVTITPTDPEGSSADEHLRAGAGLLSAALDALVEEILDSCDGATASSAEATGVADDISRGVERLGASVSDSTT